MKRTVFVLSLLMVLSSGFVMAQSVQPVVLTRDQSELSVFQMYKKSFVEAVNQGNMKMVGPHRTKLLSAMDREIAQGQALAVALDLVAEQKTIADAIRALDLTTPAGVEAAKAKLSLVDDFEKAMVKQLPKTE